MWKYYGRISKLSFLFFILFFLSFFLSFIRFFSSFFSLGFSPPYTHTHISLSSPFFFSTFHFPGPPSLFLSPALFQPFFFPTRYLAFSVIRNGERGSERKNRWVRWLCFATTAHLPPHYHLSSSPPPGWVRSASFFFFFFFFFSFSFFFSYLLVLIQLYFKNFILFCVLCFAFGLYEKQREWEEKKIRRRKRKNWYNSSCDNFVSRKIDLELLQCSLN